MADYRLDCCGGFPSHTQGCTAVAEADARKETEQSRTATLDQLYQLYGQHMANAQRATHHTRDSYAHKAEGVLEAIRIIENP